VHCAVVQQLARLAYCTAVLDQLGVELDAHPGAVAAVVALVQPWTQEGWASAAGAATPAISKQWPGGAPQLQAEAAGALVVLSSLGAGSGDLVAHAPNTLNGLLQALSPDYWKGQQEGPKQQQQQGLPTFKTPAARFARATSGSYWAALSNKQCLAGVMAELLYWSVGMHVQGVASTWYPLLLLLVALVCTGRPPAVPNYRLLWMRQQWAAYCLWWLVTHVWVKRSFLQQHVALARTMLGKFNPDYRHTGRLLATVATAFGVAGIQQPPAATQLARQPPEPPVTHATWRCRLETWGEHIKQQAGFNSGVFPEVAWLAGLWLLGAGVVWLLAKIRYLSALRHVAHLALFMGCHFGCAAAVWLFALRMQIVWKAAAAVVVTASSRFRSRPVHIERYAHSLYTELQLLSFWVLDSTPDLAYELAGTRLDAVVTLLTADSVACINRILVTAWHKDRSHERWLKELEEGTTTSLGTALAAVAVLWVVRTAWVARLLSAAAGGSIVLQWLCGAWSATLQVACVGLLVAAVLLQLCSVLLLPKYSPVRFGVYCLVFVGAVALVAVCRLKAFVAWCVHGVTCIPRAVMSLPHVAWSCTKPCLSAVAHHGPCLAVAMSRCMVYLATLPVHALLWLCQAVVAAICAALTKGAAACVSAGRITVAILSRAVYLVTLPARVPLWVCQGLVAAVIAALRKGAACVSVVSTAALQPSERSTASGGHMGRGVPALLGKGRHHGKAQHEPSQHKAGLQRHVLAPAAMAAEAHATRRAPGRLPAGALNTSPNSGSHWLWGKRRDMPQASRSVQPCSGALATGVRASTVGQASTAATSRFLAATASGGAVPGMKVAVPALESTCNPSSSTNTSSPVVAAAPVNELAASVQGPGPHTAAGARPVQPAAATSTCATAEGGTGLQKCMQVPAVIKTTGSCSPPAPVDARHDSASCAAPSVPAASPTAQQLEAALTAAQQAAQGAARVAAAAAMAAGRSPHQVLLAAAQAAAGAVQPTPGMTALETSMMVVTAAAAAAQLSEAQYMRTFATAAHAASAAAAAQPGADGSTPGGAPAAAATAGMAGSSPILPAPSSPAEAVRPKKTRTRPECVVCLDARPSVTTHPCGHRVLCGGCAQLVAASRGECPMCRAPVARYEGVTPGKV
jgi:hypothetical protein